jgi:hypothetical protein
MKYQISDDTLVFGPNEQAQFTRKFAGKIKKAFLLGERLIVLYWPRKGEKEGENLLCLSVDNQEVWRAHTPWNEDIWTEIEVLEDATLRGFTFGCYSCEIDSLTEKFYRMFLQNKLQAPHEKMIEKLA